ncbi:MAG: hypothetical protein ABIA11_03345 [Patescibacteria group bacterium]
MSTGNWIDKWVKKGNELKEEDLRIQKEKKAAEVKVKRAQEEEKRRKKREFEDGLLFLKPTLEKIDLLITQAKKVGIWFSGPKKISDDAASFISEVHPEFIQSFYRQITSRESRTDREAIFVARVYDDGKNKNYVGVTKTKDGLLIKIKFGYQTNYFKEYSQEFEDSLGEYLAEVLRTR